MVTSRISFIVCIMLFNILKINTFNELFSFFFANNSCNQKFADCDDYTFITLFQAVMIIINKILKFDA